MPQENMWKVFKDEWFGFGVRGTRIYGNYWAKIVEDRNSQLVITGAITLSIQLQMTQIICLSLREFKGLQHLCFVFFSNSDSKRVKTHIQRPEVLLDVFLLSFLPFFSRFPLPLHSLSISLFSLFFETRQWI